jgi:hypothetical protein
MANNHPSYSPRRANVRVPNLSFASEVNINGECRIELGTPVAAAAAGIMSAVSIATAITKGGTIVTTWKASLMGPYGRNVTAVLSGAGTPTLTVRGRDYLGQPVSENLVMAGATPVVGKKAFKYIDNISVGAVAATTLNVGYGNVLGVPYALSKVTDEFIDDTVAAAGTITLATPTQTATSADPRGSYIPATVPDGVHKYDLIGFAVQNNLHGVAHFYN